MLKAYIDDSHMGDRSAPIYILGGWVAPVQTWLQFSNDWDAVLRMSPRIRYFKFDDAMGLDGEFRGMSESSRNEKMRLLVNVIAEHNLTGIASIIPRYIFEGLFGSKHDEGVLKNPYTMAFYGLISRLTRYCAAVGIQDKVEFVFDYQPGGQMEKVLQGWDEFLKSGAIGSGAKFLTEHPPTFQSDKDIVALQAADLHAGWIYMLDSASFRNQPIPQPIWGDAGSKLVRHYWELTVEQAEDLYEMVRGHKPIGKFRWLNPWRASVVLRS